MKQVVVIINRKAGSDAPTPDEGDIRDAFARHGISAQVRSVAGEELLETARQAAGEGAEVIVAAGGDGTISAVASALAGSEGVMGVLPMGTLNHFAKDLKLPLELAEAARVIAQGAPRKVDVATVNGRVFLNNSSIGIYPHIVKRRDRMMERLGRGKWLSMLVAVLSLFRRFPLVRVRLGIGDKTVLRTTPFVFVGNNEYELDALALGGRKTIEGGVLCLYFANRTGRWGLFVLALRALLGRLNESKDFESLCLKEVWIESSKKRLRVSADGELMRMSPPLHYQIRPAALKVMAPRDATNDAAPG